MCVVGDFSYWEGKHRHIAFKQNAVSYARLEKSGKYVGLLFGTMRSWIPRDSTVVSRSCLKFFFVSVTASNSAMGYFEDRNACSSFTLRFTDSSGASLTGMSVTSTFGQSNIDISESME